MDFVSLVNTVNSFVWGPYMLVLLLGTGIFLTLRLGFMQIHTLPYALKLAFSKNQDKTSEGDISHFQALMTALAATIGTGNIAGVATAYVLGGPGAIFWMWVTAFFGAFAAFGIGNMVQTNSVADAVASNFGVDPLITGFVLAIFTAAVILGGIKSIGKATGIIVPFMAVFYILAGLVILAMNIGYIIPAFGTIFSSAFNFDAGFGALIGTAIMWGVKRGVFSNEAGLGSAPIAAAAAKTDHPGRQALVSMTGTFLDTIIVCSITGLVLTIAGLKAFPGLTDLTGASLTAASFDALMPMGGLIVTIGLVFFAYSTVLGWSYYGEKCFEYLIGTKGIRLYRIAFVLVAFWGATASLPLVWNIADTLNGAMAIPNLIGLLLLSGVVVSETKAFNEIRKNEAKNA
ncbi:sodium:alanine symporter family protein [Methanococcus maripaludis]|uniref:sodium/alanine symporter AgcS n=1 Tax=Methanococcus maripaludis TaxID=39152 RepID=UPI0031438A7E